MMAVFGLIPLVLLLIIIAGTGVIGLIFIAIMNIFVSFGAGSLVYYTDTFEYEIPQEKP